MMGTAVSSTALHQNATQDVWVYLPQYEQIEKIYLISVGGSAWINQSLSAASTTLRRRRRVQAAKAAVDVVQVDVEVDVTVTVVEVVE